MGIFDRFKNKKVAATVSNEKEVSRSKELEAVKKRSAAQSESDVPLKKAEGGSELSHRLLRGPHVSEKAARSTERGTYVFDVALGAEKIAVKKAVEALYKVNVIDVRMIRHAGKPVHRGRVAGRRQAWKKALVTLKKGEKIDLYEGV